MLGEGQKAEDKREIVGGLMLDKLFCLCVDIILATAYTEGMPGKK